jgi:hypothetical protein
VDPIIATIRAHVPARSPSGMQVYINSGLLTRWHSWRSSICNCTSMHRKLHKQSVLAVYIPIYGFLRRTWGLEMAKLRSSVAVFLCYCVLLSLVAPHLSALDVRAGPLIRAHFHNCFVQVI